MDPETIKEARRLIRDLVFQGWAASKTGKRIEPKDEVMVSILEKIASKKIEEPDVPMTVEGYVPKATYKEVSRAVDQDQGTETPQDPQ